MTSSGAPAPSRLDGLLAREVTVGPVRLPLERWLVGGLATLGVLAAVPSLVWPTHVVGISPLAPDRELLFQQSLWSWGRIADTTLGSTGQFDVWNVVGLVMLAVALVIGGAGATVYALRAEPVARVLGAAGIAWAASRVVGGLATRLGDTASGVYGTGDNVRTETLPAGVGEAVGCVLLLLALLVVAVQPLEALARSVARGVGRLVRRVRERVPRRGAPAGQGVGTEPGEPPAQAPRRTGVVGVARLSDAVPGHDADDGVGFSDAADDHREPPR